MTGWGGVGQGQWDARERAPSASIRPPLGYLCPGVSEQEAAGSIPEKEKDKWTNGHMERRRLHALTQPHVFFACPSWKHICPTRAADWSPRHCRHRNLSVS